jgi:signal transduction histidine kinase
MSARARALISRLTRDDLVDLALAVLMALAATVETLRGNLDGSSTAPVVLTGLLVTLPLAVRRRLPFATYLTVLVVITAQAALLESIEGVGVFFGALVGIYTVAARTPMRTAAAALLLTLPVFAYANWLSTGNVFDDLTFILVLLGGFWVAGRVVWSRQQLVEQLAAQSEELLRSRAAEHRALVAEERARIARDLHDAIAHSVSVMVVQAEAGEALLSDPERSGAALRAIQTTGRSTLAELRHVLGALNEGDSEHGETRSARVPSPRLRDVNRLVDQLGSIGFAVALHIEGDPSHLPEGVDRAAFRVLQEALTNAMRHSGGSCARATVRLDADDVVIDVVDDGAPELPTRARMANGTGRGLIGMRERVKLYGGQVEAGPTDHGFRVHVRIPTRAPGLAAQ